MVDLIPKNHAFQEPSPGAYRAACEVCGLVNSAHDKTVAIVTACVHPKDAIRYWEGAPYCRRCMTVEKMVARATLALARALGLSPCPSGECDPDYPHNAEEWVACQSLAIAMEGY